MSFWWGSNKVLVPFEYCWSSIHPMVGVWPYGRHWQRPNDIQPQDPYSINTNSVVFLYLLYPQTRLYCLLQALFQQMMTSFELYFQEKCQVDNMFMHPDLPVDRVTVALAPCVSIREFQSPDLEITAILMVYIRIISLDNFSVPRHSIF